jgi:hypothetical protein
VHGRAPDPAPRSVGAIAADVAPMRVAALSIRLTGRRGTHARVRPPPLRDQRLAMASRSFIAADQIAALDSPQRLHRGDAAWLRNRRHALTNGKAI